MSPEDETPQMWIEAVADALTTVALDDELAKTAGRLARIHALRGADAVHLATASDAVGVGGALVTWDRSLGRAALLEGLTVLP